MSIRLRSYYKRSKLLRSAAVKSQIEEEQHTYLLLTSWTCNVLTLKSWGKLRPGLTLTSEKTWASTRLTRLWVILNPHRTFRTPKLKMAKIFIWLSLKCQIRWWRLFSNRHSLPECMELMENSAQVIDPRLIYLLKQPKVFNSCRQVQKKAIDYPIMLRGLESEMAWLKMLKREMSQCICRKTLDVSQPPWRN